MNQLTKNNFNTEPLVFEIENVSGFFFELFLLGLVLFICALCCIENNKTNIIIKHLKSRLNMVINFKIMP